MADQVPYLLRTTIDRREVSEITIIFRIGGESHKERQPLIIADSADELLV